MIPNPHILVVFTFDVSLSLWQQLGILSREIAPYLELARRGSKITLLTFGGIEDLTYRTTFPEIAIVPIYTSLKPSQNRLVRFVKSLVVPVYFSDVFRDVDIIKTNQLYGSWVAIIGKFLFRKYLVIRCGYELVATAKDTGAGFSRLFLFKLLSHVSFRISDIVVVTSQRMSITIQKRYRIRADLIKIVENGIDTRRFRPSHSTPNGRVLFVGRLEEIKNVPLLLEAASQCNIGCDIVGDGSKMEELIRLAKDWNLDCQFLGVYDNSELPGLMNKYKVVVLPSVSEWSPKSLLEAMACGCLVIGTNVPGIREVIKHRETGLLVEPTPRSLAEGIRTAFTDHDLIRRLGSKARQRIESTHSFEQSIRKEISIYQTLVAK